MMTIINLDSYISADLGYPIGNGEHIVDFWTKDNTRIYAEFAGNENDITLYFWKEPEGEQAILIKRKWLGKWQNITQQQINSIIENFYKECEKA